MKMISFREEIEKCIGSKGIHVGFDRQKYEYPGYEYSDKLCFDKQKYECPKETIGYGNGNIKIDTFFVCSEQLPNNNENVFIITNSENKADRKHFAKYKNGTWVNNLGREWKTSEVVRWCFA